MNNFIFVSNLFKNSKVSVQKLMKMNLKLNIRSSLSRMPLQNTIERKISLDVFSQCDTKSNNKEIKELCKRPLL